MTRCMQLLLVAPASPSLHKHYPTRSHATKPPATHANATHTQRRTRRLLSTVSGWWRYLMRPRRRVPWRACSTKWRGGESAGRMHPCDHMHACNRLHALMHADACTLFAKGEVTCTLSAQVARRRVCGAALQGRQGHLAAGRRGGGVSAAGGQPHCAWRHCGQPLRRRHQVGGVLRALCLLRTPRCAAHALQAGLGKLRLLARSKHQPHELKQV